MGEEWEGGEDWGGGRFDCGGRCRRIWYIQCDCWRCNWMETGARRPCHRTGRVLELTEFGGGEGAGGGGVCGGQGAGDLECGKWKMAVCGDEIEWQDERGGADEVECIGDRGGCGGAV